MSKTVLLALLFGLSQACWSEPYDWSKSSLPPSLIAPTDMVSERVRGASLQGSLVDLRYGQAAIEFKGEGFLLDYNENSVFTLDGTPSSTEELVQKVIESVGLVVAVRYNPESGLIGWCDAVSTHPVPAIELALQPFRSPALVPGEVLKVVIATAESERLGLQDAQLFAPGMTHSTKFRTAKGQLVAELPILKGWNWQELPLFVRNADGKVFRGRRISVSSSGPVIESCGPQVAPASLQTFPGWLDLGGNTRFLDPSATQISVSPGAQIKNVVPRARRINFQLEVDGPGTYWIEAQVSDLLGRKSHRRWPVLVQF